MSKKLTKEEVVERFKKVHGDKYDYSSLEYNGSSHNVKIICHYHGEFNQLPFVHLKGNGCSKCSCNVKKTIKKFTSEAIKTHGNKYDYSHVRYINNRTNVEILCPIHGPFEQKPYDHIRGFGCVKCSGLHKRTTEDFIHEAVKKHGNKYDYSKVEYKNRNKKVEIKCLKHNFMFKQIPYAHLQGQGCPFCGRERINKSAKENPSGWKFLDWEKSANRSKWFDSFKVYIIRCWDEKESFYKIGRTFLTTKRRFRSTNVMPYDYEIVKEFVFDNAKECFYKEIELKKINRNNKYRPYKKFNGFYECFTNIILCQR